MGDVIRFPGKPHETAGEAEYRFQVYPLPVRRVNGDLFDPMPNQHWTNEEVLRWFLGVIALTCPIHIDLRRSSPASGTYSLAVGARRPITALNVVRVRDILAGVYELGLQVEVVTDES